MSWSRRSRAAVVLVVAAGAQAGAGVVHESVKLVPEDGGNGNNFGAACAIGGGIIAVGSYAHRFMGVQSGTVYVYGTSGQLLWQLVGDDRQAGDGLGWSVGVGGGVVIAGAIGDDDNGDSSGSAYLFDPVSGSQLHKLKPNDGSTQDEFGRSVAVGGGYAVVGARYEDAGALNTGSAYVFDVTTGAQLRKLIADDRASEDRFGESIAIDGGLVVVGAPYDDDQGARSGSAYVFDAATGAQLHKLVPSSGSGDHYFGLRVAIGDGLVAVTQPGEGAGRGALFLFDAATGAELRKIVPSDGAAGDNFGSYGVGISGGLVTAGSPWDTPNGPGSGSGYLFDANTGAELAKLVPSDGASGDNFGFGACLDSGVVVMGRRFGQTPTATPGTAYVFDLAPPEPCNLADLVEPFGVLDLDDVTAFVDAFVAGDPAADLDGSGLLDLRDITDFVAAFSGGCP